MAVNRSHDPTVVRSAVIAVIVVGTKAKRV